jgi:hypothetical protein
MAGKPTHSPEGMEIMYQNDDGWSDWIHPLPGYRLQCCGCGLIHDMQFEIVPSVDNGPYNPGESDDGVIIFRASREGEGE